MVLKCAINQFVLGVCSIFFLSLEKKAKSVLCIIIIYIFVTMSKLCDFVVSVVSCTVIQHFRAFYRRLVNDTLTLDLTLSELRESRGVK